MQQYPIIIPKTHTNIKYEVMKFNIPLKNEFIPNLPGKIYRQNEYAEAAGDKKSQPRPEENNADGGEEPKFGAGSSYSHFMRGDKKHKFEKRATTKSDDKTWMMNLGTGKSLRSYKGTKEGNMGENSSYYVFMQSADGSAFEAYPISTWYSFTPVPKHKTLDYDEAENEFLRRDKVLNYFSIMIQKRLMTSQGKQDLINEEEELKNSGLKNNKRIAVDKDLLTIRDVDLTEFEADDREHDGSELDDSETIKDGSKSKPRSKKLQHKGMKKKEEEEKDEEHEPLEESDDGDVEGQEMDYMSSTSSDSSYSPTAPNNANKNIAKHDSQVRNKDDPSLTEPMEELQDYETELIGVADELGLKELHFDSEDDDEEKEGMENNLEKALSKNENIENVGNTELLKVAEGVDIMGVGKDKKTGSKKNKKVKKERPVKYAKNQAESNKLYNEEMIDGGNVSSSDNNSSVNSNGSLSSSGTESSSISSSTNDSDIEIDDNNIRSSIFLQKKTDSFAANINQNQKELNQDDNVLYKRKYPFELSVDEISIYPTTSNNKAIKRRSGDSANDDSSNLVDATYSINNLTSSDLDIVLNAENVKRYLQRRPMTTKELLHKFKSRVGTREQLAERMTLILKQLNPEKKFIKGKMYLLL